LLNENFPYLKTEYKALLQVAGQNKRDFAIVMLFLQTGLRVSELVNLRIGDVTSNTLSTICIREAWMIHPYMSWQSNRAASSSRATSSIFGL